jgi:hypothetical protein
MDDIFDNLIYIIITIVAFAISALGKKKKKDTRRTSNLSNVKPVQERTNPFFANLEQLFNEEIAVPNQNYQNQYIEEVVVEKKPEPEIEQPLDFVPPEMLDDIEDVPYSIEYDDSEDISSSSIKDAEITPEEDQPVIEGFNLRDAVIYSEIMNRKEY